MSPRHNPEASSTVMLPPAVCSGRLHSWRKVTFTWRQWTVLSLHVKGEAAEQKQFSFTRFSWKLDSGAVSPSIIPFCASSWRGVPITYRHQEIFSSLKPFPRPCTGIHAELYFSTFRANHALLLFSIFNLNLECVCGTQEQQRIPSQIFPKRPDCRSCYSQQEMHGKPLRTVFDFSKTHWNKKRDSYHLGTSDYRKEDLK